VKTNQPTDLTRIRNQEYLLMTAGLLRGNIKSINALAKKSQWVEPGFSRLTNAELAADLAVSVASVTRYIVRLEEIGIIEVEQVPGIGRKIKVLLTAKEARKLLEEGSRS
jgi:DNA-binding MarR family transcriptional regulator